MTPPVSWRWLHDGSLVIEQEHRAVRALLADAAGREATRAQDETA